MYVAHLPITGHRVVTQDPICRPLHGQRTDGDAALGAHPLVSIDDAWACDSGGLAHRDVLFAAFAIAHRKWPMPIDFKCWIDRCVLGDGEKSRAASTAWTKTRAGSKYPNRWLIVLQAKPGYLLEVCSSGRCQHAHPHPGRVHPLCFGPVKKEPIAPGKVIAFNALLAHRFSIDKSLAGRPAEPCVFLNVADPYFDRTC